MDATVKEVYYPVLHTLYNTEIAETLEVVHDTAGMMTHKLHAQYGRPALKGRKRMLYKYQQSVYLTLIFCTCYPILRSTCAVVYTSKPMTTKIGYLSSLPMEDSPLRGA